MSSKFIPPSGTPAMPAKPQLNPKDLPDIKCENPACGNVTFQEVVLLKRVPAFMTTEGKDGLVPIPVFACNACGFVNEMFVPSFMKGTAPAPTEEAPAAPTKSLIEIVK